MAITIEQIPTELVDNYRGGKCGFFVGAGLSVGAGFPRWKGLVLGLIDKAEADHSIDAEKATECRELAEDSGKYLMLAEEMKEILGVEIKSYLEDTFLDETIHPQAVHELLVTLKKNKFIITTNYDQLIELALVRDGRLPNALKFYEAHAIQRKLYQREFFLLKAHGDANTAAENIVLTDKDYRRLLYQQPGYQSALQSIFTMYSVIFIGCSLEDPELRLLLNYINAAFPEGGVPHYALMSTENTRATERNRWKKDYNMRIIPVSPNDNYADVDTFLTILHEQEAA